MKVLVLGATGSVGRHVASALLDAGYGVHGIARKPPSYEPDHRMAFTAMDITGSGKGDLKRLIETSGSVAVVNAAGGWGDTFEEMRYSHVKLADRLLEELSLLEHPTKLVHFGSVHEYGEPASASPMTEEQRPCPVSEYAQVKARVSAIVLEAQNVQSVVLRCGNMYGPHPPAESFLAALMERINVALRSDSVLEIPVANSARDYVDVRDAARAAVCAVSASDPPRVVNVGRGCAEEIRTLVESLLDASEMPRSRVRLINSSVNSKGGQWTCLDVTVAKEHLGWQPEIDLATSIRDMWRSRLGS